MHMQEMLAVSALGVPIFVHFIGSFWIDSRISDSTHLNSGLLVEAGSGSDLSFAYLAKPPVQCKLCAPTNTRFK